MAQSMAIERVDHIGVRVRNLDRALAFYRMLGFAVLHRAEGDDVAIIRHPPASPASSSSRMGRWGPPTLFLGLQHASAFGEGSVSGGGVAERSNHVVVVVEPKMAAKGLPECIGLG
jgi:catechol 2,3-dioxygenase-like lactoylglutathione lyase family enzyme